MSVAGRLVSLQAPSRLRPSGLLPPAFDRPDGFGAATRSADSSPALADADIRLLNALAAFQVRYGKPAEALALLQLTVRLAPGDPQSLRLLSEAFLATGDGDTAHAAFVAYEAAAGREASSAPSLLRRARLMRALRRAGEALDAFSRCLQLRRAAR